MTKLGFCVAGLTGILVTLVQPAADHNAALVPISFTASRRVSCDSMVNPS
jgi:hypothetical protein